MQSQPHRLGSQTPVTKLSRHWSFGVAILAVVQWRIFIIFHPLLIKLVFRKRQIICKNTDDNHALMQRCAKFGNCNSTQKFCNSTIESNVFMKFCFHSFILKVMSCRSSPSPTPLNVFIKFRFPNSTLGEIPTITSTLGECLHEVPLRKFRLGIMSSQSSSSTIPLLVVCHSKVSLMPPFHQGLFWS